MLDPRFSIEVKNQDSQIINGWDWPGAQSVAIRALTLIVTAMHVPLTEEEQEKLDYLLGAFGSAAMRPPRMSLFYGLGLVAVTLIMILLPLIYVSLVALLGF